MRRGRDWLWLAGTLTIVAGFGTIAVAGFVWPTSEISSIDGRCRIGLPRYVTIPLLTFDVIINVFLTLIFVYLLSPLIRAGSSLPTSAFPASHLTKCLGRCGRGARTSTSVDLRPANQAAAKKIEKLLWRTFIGSCLVLTPTAGNLASLTSLKGRELGWVCLTVCTFDSMFVRAHTTLHVMLTIQLRGLSVSFTGSRLGALSSRIEYQLSPQIVLRRARGSNKSDANQAVSPLI